MRGKLRSKRGTTLMEVLVAAALMGLLAAGVGAGISAAGPVCNDSLALSESSLLFSTLTQLVTDELRYARDIKVNDSGEIRYTSSRYGEGTRLINQAADSSGAVHTGRIWVESSVGTFLLLGEGAYTTLMAAVELTYDTPAPGDTENTVFHVEMTITRPDGGEEVRSFEVYPILQ